MINYFVRNQSIVIVLKYGIFGSLWVILSDSILEVFAGNFEIYKNLQTYKGWIFIFLTMIIVYILINKREKRIINATGESSKAIRELRHMAYYDTLTGLPNRAMFVSKIKNLANSSRQNFAIAFLDIDNFKYINDTLGHYIGDDFLKFMAYKMSKEIKAPDMVARLGGDEFAILIRSFETKDILINRLENIKNSIGNTWNSGSREFYISMSIGIAVYPDDGYDFDTLLKHSDIAMYAAKKEGKNKMFFYEEDIHYETIWHIQMANKLQKGLDCNEFELNYQPQVQLSTGDIIGTEALVRWNRPQEGYISPADFIPVAEITGQIYELERRIIKNVLIQKKKWEEQGLNDLELSLNLSGKSLISNSNFRQIEEIFSDCDVDYSNIVIEITETAAITHIDTAIERLNILKAKGLKIALDDFGTGYSSLTYLRRLPIDIVKLDKSYIGNGDKKDISIIKFIVSLAHDLGIRVIAEGIETIEQYDYLRTIECECGQGYYLGQPMYIDELNELLTEKFEQK